MSGSGPVNSSQKQPVFPSSGANCGASPTPHRGTVTGPILKALARDGHLDPKEVPDLIEKLITELQQNKLKLYLTKRLAHSANNFLTGPVGGLQLIQYKQLKTFQNFVDKLLEIFPNKIIHGLSKELFPQMLEMPKLLDDKIKTVLETMNRVIAVNKAILGIQKTGQDQPQINRYELRDFIDGYTKVHKPSLDGRGIGFEIVNNIKGNFQVNTDVLRLQMILDNFLRNAELEIAKERNSSDNTAADKTYWIKVVISQKGDGKLYFAVSNNGPAIDSEVNLKDLGTKPVKSTHQGAGIGLEHSTRLSKELGGEGIKLLSSESPVEFEFAIDPNIDQDKASLNAIQLSSQLADH